MKDIAIFSFKDSSAGQIINMLSSREKKKINCIISINKIPKLNLILEHKKRPNKKTEFVKNKKFLNFPVFDNKDYLKILKKRKIKKAYIAEDTGLERSKIFKELKKKNIKILSLIHKSVMLMGHNTIGEGTIIYPNCYIGYKADIGNGCIIQSGATIEHHNSIGNFCDINPNLTTGGFTKIGNFCTMNISVDVINRIHIGDKARVGAGSLVINNVKPNKLYYGRPAKEIKKNN